MAAESKRPKLKEESTEIIESKYSPSTLFSLSDVILDVEGFKLHVHKQVLTDKSPVFKRMFESDFKEKHQIEIPLPGKEINDFEEFLWTLYHPEFRPITKDNIFKILPLADEYQVSTIKNMCESFIIQTLKQVASHGQKHPGIATLLNYASNVEKYHLSAALPHIVHLCAKHSFESLTRAAEKVPISKEILGQICIERTKATDTLTKQKMENGDFSTLLETLDLQFERNCVDYRFYDKYEDQLVKACNDNTITRTNLVDFIIAGERYNLRRLLPTAIRLATMCRITPCTRFSEISNDSKAEILRGRLIYIDRYGTGNDLNLNF